MSRAQENYMNKWKKNQQQHQASYGLASMPPQPYYPPPQQTYTLTNGQQVMPMMDMTGNAALAPPPPPQAKEQEQDVDPDRAKNILPIYGSSSTFNINTLLFNNIMEADYFKALYQLRTYHEIVGMSFT